MTPSRRLLVKCAALASWAAVLVACDHLIPSWWARTAVAAITAVPMAWVLNGPRDCASRSEAESD
ncbi:hypothetical protein [Streptomyces sp. NPDC048606]|uniref:hypothetical protein n=1 Tax=Streptomyces sp. NPDC048606 TaxID=3154726 RepID=UPI00341C7F9F